MNRNIKLLTDILNGKKKFKNKAIKPINKKPNKPFSSKVLFS